MFAALRGLFRKKAPAIPQTVVRAAGTAGAARGLAPGMLDMETVMTAASVQARHEGITDVDVIRKRKLVARAALKAARHEASSTQRPSSFRIGAQVFTVTP